MLPRSHQPTRRRSAVGPPQLCAIAAILLLLLSLSVLHSRLSSSTLSSSPSSSSITTHFDLIDAQSHSQQQRRPTTLSLDLIDDLDIVESEPDSTKSNKPSLIWDHILGVARIPFRSHSTTTPDSDSDSNSLADFDLLSDSDTATTDTTTDSVRIVYSSDDYPIDNDIRAQLSSISTIEDALLLKSANKRDRDRDSPLRDRWAKWLEGKSDFLRKNRMLQSNLDLLNPKNHPLLQDPDGFPGLTGLTRGDRLVQRVLLSEMETVPFVGKPERRRELHEKMKKGNGKEEGKKAVKRKGGQRWGYYPGIDPYLSFNKFMQRFFAEENKCEIKVLMVWNSPQWTYGVRHQRGLESLLKHHNHACVVVFSETMELEFFKDFVKDGYKVAVAVPNLDELLEDTPTREFSSFWFDWRKTKHYPLHYSELIRLAALYKYGGIYLDSDVIVLKLLSSVQNSISLSGYVEGNSTFSGAVMAFDKNSEFVMECLREFHATYDDSRLRWNGADLLTRVINKLNVSNQLDVNILSSFQFFPISSSNITSYFAEPSDATDVLEQEILLKRIMEQSSGFHMWNSITSYLVPEPSSLVEKILNHFCVHCLDTI